MTPAEFHITSELTAGDLGMLISLHGKLYADEHGFGVEFEHYVAKGLLELTEAADRDKNRIWVCKHRNRIAGCIAAVARENNRVQLRYYFVHPEYRRRGIGNTLMETFVNFAKEQKFETAFLWTTSELEDAARMYKKSGFSIVEEFDSDAFGKKTKEQCYEMVVS